MRTFRFLLSVILLSTVLSGCLIPVWDDGYYGGHRHGGRGHGGWHGGRR